MATEHPEPRADTSSNDPTLLRQVPKLPNGRSAAEIKWRMRNFSESALGSRGVERRADSSKAFALTDLWHSDEPAAPEPAAPDH
jgi:hypothetical protein